VSDITTVSRGGTNQLHGGLFENHQNTALNARNPFSSSKTRTIMNNYGVFVGGPLNRAARSQRQGQNVFLRKLRRSPANRVKRSSITAYRRWLA